MADHASGPSRIIIADDHPLFRSALARSLEGRSGLEVVAQAGDGREALELCCRLKPDLVMMDVRMPNIDGLEATRAVKAELPRTIVLVITASEDLDHLAEALRAGAAGYILKSATPQQMTDAIRRALEGESPLDQELAMRLLRRLTAAEEQGGQGREGTGRGNVPQQRRPFVAALDRGLTHREGEVLRLIAQGKSNRQISQDLLVSTSTVKNHVQQILSKLGASDRTQAAIMAIEMGLLSGPLEGA
jgi:DNA-binding NarL/FixJ family response regulator